MALFLKFQCSNQQLLRAITLRKDVSFSLESSLLPATTKAVIGIWVWKPSDITNRTWHLIPSVGRVTALIVVERANLLPVLGGFSCFSMNWNFCITVGIRRLGTNLSAGLLLSRVTHKDNVFTAASPTWTGASPAGSSGRHVKRLPAQVVQRVLVVTRHKEALGQAAIAVEHSETRRFPRFVEYSFQFGNLKRQHNWLNITTLGWMIDLSSFFQESCRPKDSHFLTGIKE